MGGKRENTEKYIVTRLRGRGRRAHYWGLFRKNTKRGKETVVPSRCKVNGEGVEKLKFLTVRRRGKSNKGRVKALRDPKSGKNGRPSSWTAGPKQEKKSRGGALGFCQMQPCRVQKTVIRGKWGGIVLMCIS